MSYFSPRSTSHGRFVGADAGYPHEMTSAAGRLDRGVVSQESRAQARSWIRPLARAGLAARTVIYAVLALLAYLIVARGHAPSQASGQGALAEIEKQPAGPLLLGLLSAGLVAYGLWRLAQAIFGVDPSESDRPSGWKRFGWLWIAGVYFALFAQAVQLMGSGSAGRSGGGPSTHPQPYAAAMLGWPAGPELAGLLGAGIIIGGVALAIWGCVHDYSDTLRQERMYRGEQIASRVTGIFGNVTRGVLIALIGVYFILAAVDDAPSKVKSLDQLLQTVEREPAGLWWLAIAATGLAAFAVHSAFETAYRRV